MGRFSGLLLVSALSLWAFEGVIAAPIPPAIDSAVDEQFPATGISVAAEADLSDLNQQIGLLLQAAQVSAQQGETVTAIVQLEQAAELAVTLPLGDRRDYWLSPIGIAFVDLKAFDRAEAIAQNMTYETLGTNDLLRVDLEKALVKGYIQSEQLPQAVQLIESFKPEMRDQFWVLAVEVLAQQGDTAAATSLFANIVDQSYFRLLAINAINRAYIGAEAFDAAQAFLAQHPFTDPLDQGAGLDEVALWAARANQLETAVAIAQQIPATRRAALLVELARLYQASGQDVPATNLLAEAANLPRRADSAYGDLETFSKIAALYVSLEQPAAARGVLETAMQRESSATSVPLVEWVDAFAKIGAFDKATQLAESVPVSERHDPNFRMATAYTDQGQYEPAITLLSTIPDGILFPLPEYPDPKLELLNRIIDEATQQNQFAVAKRAAQVMQAPVDQVRAWRKIATVYQAQQQQDQAIEALDRASTVAKTIEKYGFHADRHSYYEVSNADLLIAIAEGYWAASESEKAIVTAQLALQSAQNFESTFSYPGFTINSLEKIGQLARQWQQPELLEASIAEINKRTAPDISSDLLIENLTRQVTMAYEPGAALSEESQSAIARMETLREQATSPEQELAILRNLTYLYNFTQQPALAQTTLDRSLVLVEPLSADLRDNYYTQMILAITKDQTSERVADLLPLLSSPSQQVNVLVQITRQYASENQSEQAIASFEQASQIASQNLSERDRDAAIIGLANAYSYFYSPPYSTAPRTPAEIALMRQIPHHVSDPLARARVQMNFMPHLSPAEAETAYTELASTLAEIPNAYARRDLLWQGITEALSYQKPEQAAQLANALDGDYRQIAVGFVEKQR
jgi:hypothetical protein